MLLACFTASQPAVLVPGTPHKMQAAPSDSGRRPAAELRHRPLIPVLVGFASGIAADNLWQPRFLLWALLGCLVLILTAWGSLRRMRPWGNWLLAVLLPLPVGGAWDALAYRE